MIKQIKVFLEALLSDSMATLYFYEQLTPIMILIILCLT